MVSASCRSLLDHLEHNGQSGRSRGTAAVFVSLSSLIRTSRPAARRDEALIASLERLWITSASLGRAIGLGL